MLQKVISFIKYRFEGLIWVLVLNLMAINAVSDSHYTLCPLSSMGFNFCPGCGLGRSISMLLHGNIASSFSMHPLGIPIVITLIIRSCKILTKKIY